MISIAKVRFIAAVIIFTIASVSTEQMDSDCIKYCGNNCHDYWPLGLKECEAVLRKCNCDHNINLLDPTEKMNECRKFCGLDCAKFWRTPEYWPCEEANAKCDCGNIFGYPKLSFAVLTGIAFVFVMCISCLIGACMCGCSRST